MIIPWQNTGNYFTALFDMLTSSLATADEPSTGIAFLKRRLNDLRQQFVRLVLARPANF